MRVPLNDTKRQYLAMADEIDVAVRATMAGGWYVMGEEHNRFEAEFATYCHRPFAVAVGNGTDALEIALRAIGCRAGDEVITVANAGGYATTAIVLVGATPVFVDVAASSLTMSPDSVAQALGARTKAVVVTHLYGKMADVAGVQQAIAGRQIAVIEDCAQAHGAVSENRKAGSMGDMGAFSFYPTKNLGALGDGGAIVTERPEYAERARMLRQYGWSEKYQAVLPEGRNSRLDELHAAILRKKLPHLDGWNQRRREIVARYRDAATGTPLRFVHRPASDYVAHLCVALHPDRDALKKRLEEKGIGAAVHYPIPDHRQESLRDRSWRAVDLPNTERAVSEILTFPCFAEMTDSEIDYVCWAIRELS
jgi:dTDP-3-amino-2,3,6-trideoxy-4-keto-D-glucose/dTDP-3-amino-3,4,6-trideoxy-alpha-D-glucose/dTDP-2,6-dideoxy-D-kanosamine transaminase